MIRCTDMAVFLSDYADDAADERGRRIVERHIQLCNECRQLLLVQRHLAQQMQRLTLLPPGVAARLPRYQREIESRLFATLQARRRLPWIALAVLVFLVLEAGAAVWMLRGFIR